MPPPAPPADAPRPAVQAAALPGTVDGYRAFRRAYQTSSAGDLGQAIAFYTQSIESGDLSVEDLALAFYNRANAYHGRGALAYAIADYDRAIVNDPELPAAYYNRGVAYRALGDEARAQADFAAARARGWDRSGGRAADLPPPRR
jgi:tetratricopeptide (TPR) repeat protein